MGSKRLQTVILLVLLAVAFAFYVQWSSHSDGGPGSTRQSADSSTR